MGRIGLSDQFFLPKNIEWEGSFYMQQKTQISKDDIPCSEVCSKVLGIKVSDCRQGGVGFES